jgi:hypothetical protein
MLLTKNDRDALQLAIKHCRAHDKASRAQINDMLKDRPWIEVAEFASFSAQTDSLDAAPFEHLPCDLPDDYDPITDPEPIKGCREAYRLREQMADLGISRWHPDPVAAITVAKAKRKATSAP